MKKLQTVIPEHQIGRKKNTKPKKNILKNVKFQNLHILSREIQLSNYLLFLSVMQPMKDFQATASTNIDEVIDAYEHAVLSIWPKNRYTVGLSTKYFLIPLAYFPTTISDAILMMLED